MKKRIYKKVENGIEYLIFEAPDYSYFNKYYRYFSDIGDPHFVVENNISVLPKKYKNNITHIIFIIHQGRIETYYYHKNLEHNLYGPAYTRVINNKIIISEYYICGEKYKHIEWLLKIRKYKLLNLASLSTSQNL